MTSQPSTFTAQLIGRTEKSLNALLARALVDTGLTERQWVTLNLAMQPPVLDRTALVERVAGVIHVPVAEADGLVGSMMRLGLVDVDATVTVRVSEHGRQLFHDVSEATAAIAQRLWGDAPADDLAVAARVLGDVLARATAELSGARHGPRRA